MHGNGSLVLWPGFGIQILFINIGDSSVERIDLWLTSPILVLVLACLSSPDSLLESVEVDTINGGSLHNSWLMLLARTGIVGFVLVLWLPVSVIFAALGRGHRKSSCLCVDCVNCLSVGCWFFLFFFLRGLILTASFLGQPLLSLIGTY